MVDGLTATQWRDVAHAWLRLGALSPSDFDGVRDALVEEARALLRADWVTLSVATLDAPPEGDPLFGWRLQLAETSPVADELDAGLRDAMRRGLYLRDKRARVHAAGAGATRVSLRSDGDGTGDAMRARLDEWGVADQIVGVLTLTLEVEVYLFASRNVGRPPFDEGDRALLRAAIEGFRPAATHLVRSYGLLGPVPLTPRQRQVVALLLRGLSEKELAAELGVSPTTAHEHVVEAYRKLHVRSRPELLALWLSRRG